MYFFMYLDIKIPPRIVDIKLVIFTYIAMSDIENPIFKKNNFPILWAISSGLLIKNIINIFGIKNLYLCSNFKGIIRCSRKIDFILLFTDLTFTSLLIDFCSFVFD